MASIQTRGKTTYVVWRGTDAKGESKQIWSRCDNKKQANLLKAKIEASSEKTAPSDKTLRELIADYIEIYGKAKWAPKTYTNRLALLENYVLPYIGDIKVVKLTPRRMDEYFAQLGKVESVQRYGQQHYVSPRTINEVYKALRSIFNVAKKWRIISGNPVDSAIIPEHHYKKRVTWSRDEFLKANELCTDTLLKVAMNIAVSTTIRSGEILGLTWDCVFVSDEDIDTGNCRIYIEKELAREKKSSLKALNNKGVLLTFPDALNSTSVLVLKKPKTESSIRYVWLPVTTARILQQHKEYQEKERVSLGAYYQDYNLVIAQPNGRPLSEKVLLRRLEKLIKEHDLKEVVFHSLRHTSVAYKLKIKPDIKSVQGDSGHATAQMVTEQYNEVVDEDRKVNAQYFETSFYQGKSIPATVNPEAIQMFTMLMNNHELLEQLMSAIDQNAKNSFVRKSVDKLP